MGDVSCAGDQACCFASSIEQHPPEPSMVYDVNAQLVAVAFAFNTRCQWNVKPRREICYSAACSRVANRKKTWSSPTNYNIFNLIRFNQINHFHWWCFLGGLNQFCGQTAFNSLVIDLKKRYFTGTATCLFPASIFFFMKLWYLSTRSYLAGDFPKSLRHKKFFPLHTFILFFISVSCTFSLFFSDAMF